MASTKKSFIIFFILIMAVTVNIKAQQKNSFDPKGLKLTITEVDNNYQNKGQAIIKLAITNTAKQALPATGWNIFFNSKNNLQTIDKEPVFTIQQLTGNLFQLKPAQAFKPLSPNETDTVRVILDALLINKNDQPEGFYLVWDDAPTKAINIKNIVTVLLPIQPINGSIISDFATGAYNRYAAIEKILAENVQKIFPTPASFKNSGKAHAPLTGVGNAADKPFLLSSTVQISADAVFNNEANLLGDDLFTLLGKKINVVATPLTNNTINLIKKDGLPAEGYELNVSADGVAIAAATPAGIFYGIQSLKSLLPAEAWKTSKVKKPIALQSMVVIDSPRFGYRGFLLDVARNFQTKKEVLRVLDLMAMYKLNSFHFHLTDDEGWRLQIDGLPELTEIGARRGHSLDEKEHMPAAYGSGGVTDSL
ncbi:MAG: carbohydate-binding domain-containing protein, partial [Ferruginibacter sp.]|nr:carbohydate-binding domain-containing protein [Ferruginibacter sp.]